MDRVVVVTEAQLVELIRTTVSEVLAASTATEPPDHVTIAEAAKLLHVSSNTVRRRISLGLLKSSQAREGAKVLITLKSVQKLLKA